ncbi:MAG: efflux RND transporter periplasmic adaptor subunit [Thermoanaerobaculia bacterium]
MKHKKLLLLLVPVLCAACKGKKNPSAFQRPPAPVTVETAIARDVPVYADEVGKCVAREVVSIVPQVSGRITEIHFADGANVKTGQILFTIDPRPYQAQLDAAEANLAQARAARELARTELARSAELLKAQLVSQSDYDTKKSTAQVDEAQVQQAEASVNAARLNLQYCSIHSPIDGRAGHRLVDLGNVVAANGASLLTIERLDPIYADFTVTENDLSRVQQHMAHGELKVEVRLPDEPGKPLTGTLTFLDNTVQESTGTVTLRATVPNREHRLWPGRFVKVRLVLATLKAAVLVPATAVQVSAKGPFVYVVGSDSTAELRPVVPGQSQEALVVIEKGLKAGERVVVNGQLAVTPGGKVLVSNAAESAS